LGVRGKDESNIIEGAKGETLFSFEIIPPQRERYSGIIRQY
jgi:hypothetical protein